MFSSRVLSKEASMDESEMITFSFPKPLIPLDVYAITTEEAVPIKDVTVEALISMLVLASSMFKSSEE